ncbi:UDP-3-O-(3-hydroxymyristoyl)glucosamine N-acyltransferase [Thermosynechococcaceae cyanobacterium Okahandja]
MQLSELAQRFGASLEAVEARDRPVLGVAPLEAATATDVSFLANPKYTSLLQRTAAAAVFVRPDFEGEAACPLLRVPDPYLAFAQCIELFYPQPQPSGRIHPTAIIGEEVELGAGVSIGAYTVIGDRVRIGDRTVIHSHCTLYDNVVVGADCLIHSHCALREGVKLGDRVILQNSVVLGADGFGYVPLPDGRHYKIPQVGTVVLGDDVEIGAGTTIDRATLGETKVGAGSKIDNLTMVAHNCTIGEHAILCAQVGLAGSTHVGNHVILAGQVGAAGHLSIGDRAIVSAKSGISSSVPAQARMGGIPAMEQSLYLRVSAAVKQLPELLKRVRALEAKLGSGTIHANK